MKTRTILLFMVLCSFFVGYCSAQAIGYSTVYEEGAINLPISGTSTKTIGHYYSGALSYYEYLDQSNPNIAVLKGRFVYNYTGTNIYSFNMPDNIYVTDFMQCDNMPTIYFCGYKNTTQTVGIVGWIDIMNTYSNAEIYYIEVPEFSKMTKMAVYKTFFSIEVVALGREQNSTNQNSIFYTDKIHDLIVGTCNYHYAPVRQNQFLYDIVKTKNYIVFAGYDVNCNGICLRKEKYGNIVQQNLLENVYFYPMTDGEPSTSITTAYLDNDILRSDDSIVLSTPTFVEDFYTESRFRMFDISTMSMFNSQMFISPAKTDTYGMAFMKNNNKLAVLQSSEPKMPTTHSAVVLLKPFATTNYIADYVYKKEHAFNSIDNLNQALYLVDHFLLGGFYDSKIDWLLKDGNSLPSPNSCNSTSTTEVSIIDNIPTKQDLDHLFFHQSSSNYFHVIHNTTLTTPTNICTDN